MRGEQEKRRGRGQAARPAIWTVKQIEALKPEAKEYAVRHAKETGLWLVVKPSGVKTWQLFYSFGGKQRKLVIGQMGLADAEAEVDKARIQLREKMDPASAKQALKRVEKRSPAKRAGNSSSKASGLAAPDATPDFSRAITGPIDAFETVARLYIESYAKPRKRRWQESQRLLQNVTPALKGKRLSELKPSDWLAVLDPVWRKAPIAGNRLHSELSSLCVWAAGLKKRGRLKAGQKDFVDPPDELVALFAHVSPFRDVPKRASESAPRKRVLADWELAVVWRAAEGLGFPYGDIIRMLLLTGERRGEVANLPRHELDLNHAIWNLPDTRAKNGLAHVIPLAPGARAILNALPQFARGNGVDYLFGLKPPKNFSDAKKRLDSEILKLHGAPLENWRFHDLRRSFVSGCGRLGIDLHVIERCINHVSGTFGGVRGIYQHAKFEHEMRHAMEIWDDHVRKIVSESESAAMIAEPA